MKIICPHCLTINGLPKKDVYKKADCGSCKRSFLRNSVANLSSINIDRVIENSEIPIIIDFWAPWCAPCKSFSPIFSAVAKKFPLKALFAKVDTEQEQFLSSRFKIKSIPTLVVFNNKKEIERVSGSMNEDSFLNFVKKFI